MLPRLRTTITRLAYTYGISTIQTPHTRGTLPPMSYSAMDSIKTHASCRVTYQHPVLHSDDSQALSNNFYDIQIIVVVVFRGNFHLVPYTTRIERSGGVAVCVLASTHVTHTSAMHHTRSPRLKITYPMVAPMVPSKNGYAVA